MHTKIPSPSQLARTSQAPQLVILKGIWAPPKYASHVVLESQQTLGIF